MTHLKAQLTENNPELRPWRPLAGGQSNSIEPRHQFEWAWLLLTWVGRRERPDVAHQAVQLIEIAETYDIDQKRGAAVNALGDDFSVRDAFAKLWPQTERIKAWCAAFSHAQNIAEKDSALERLTAALASLRRFLDRSPKGLWWETMQPTDEFLPEAAKASSFYHIMGAILALEDIVQGTESKIS
ncbi:MAG: AGE family epimerase/isomerase [Pseudomonadota bacterium]